MNKQIRDFKVNYPIDDWKSEIEISKMKQDLENLEKLGATHIEIDPPEYDSSFVEINVISRRIETDEEYNERMKKIDAENEHQKEMDLYLLEKIKTKYGL